MLRVITVALLLLATGAPATVQDRLAHPAVDLRGALYRVVFVSATDALSARDVAALPADVRTRVSQFLTRRRTLEQAGEGTPPDPRELLEHSIVALVDREDARALAADFLREALIANGWGDSAAAPLKEASYAEKRQGVEGSKGSKGPRVQGSKSPRVQESKSPRVQESK
jgi:hypothetical protein